MINGSKIFVPSFGIMDNGFSADSNNMDALVLHHEGIEASDDLLVRRVKNRERQRRYRACKRREADLKKASIIHETTSPHLLQIASELLPASPEPDSSLILSNSDFLTRVYCPRNWKKDARRGTCGTPATKLDFAVEQDQPTSHSSTALSTVGLTRCLQPSRRDWKADARNKKASN